MEDDQKDFFHISHLPSRRTHPIQTDSSLRVATSYLNSFQARNAIRTIMSTRTIIVIDIGSSSIRCSAYELQSETASSSSPVIALEGCRSARQINSVQSNTGKIHLKETENNKSFMDNVEDCMDEVLDKLRSKLLKSGGFQVLAVGISSFVMNLVGVDCHGKIVGDEASMSYACNSSNVAQKCRNLKRELSTKAMEEMYQKTGAPIHSAYALPQLLDIYDDKNQSYQHVRQSVHKWQTIASICASRWTGTTFLPISFSEASWTGLLNFHTCEYEMSVLELLPQSCQLALPDLSDYTDSAYDIRQHIEGVTASNPYWDRWPELRGGSDGGCRLFLGVSDGACANLGSKCSTASRIAVTIGTSAAARVCLPLQVGATDTMQVPRGLFCYRIDRSHILVGGALTDGGCVVEWISNLLNLSSKDAFNECMSKVEHLIQREYAQTPGTTDGSPQRPKLTVVPFLSGERSTGYRDGATGAMLGLTRETTPAHLLKGCLEGVTLRLQAVLTLIQHAMKESQEEYKKPCIVASGKALEVNDLWRQLLSDCSGLEVIMDKETEEGTSRGMAVALTVALSAADGFERQELLYSDEPLVVASQSSPNLDAEIFWQQATAAQESLIDSISPLYN